MPKKYYTNTVAAVLETLERVFPERAIMFPCESFDHPQYDNPTYLEWLANHIVNMTTHSLPDALEAARLISRLLMGVERLVDDWPVEKSFALLEQDKAQGLDQPGWVRRDGGM